MDTKNIKLKGGENKKAGKDTTQTILTATGAAVIGAIGGAAVMNSSQEAELPIEPYEDELAEQTTVEENEQVEDKLPETEAEQDNGQAADDNAGTQEEITQPQPTDSNMTNTPEQPQHTGGNEGNQQGGENVEPSNGSNGPTPEEIAQDIIGKDEIDPNDIDTPSVFAVDELTTVYNEMGNEVAAAMIHTPDGTQYLLADSDGDGVFEGVYDAGGNFVTLAESNITQSDLVTMLDQTGGYLALTGIDRPWVAPADPTGDIIDTETGEHVTPAQYMAENNTSSGGGEADTDGHEDIEDVDEVLAQLLDETEDVGEAYPTDYDMELGYDDTPDIDEV